MGNFSRVILLAALLVVGGLTVVVATVRERSKETMAAIYADMHNLATWQAAYYNDNSRFASDLSDRYRPTHGATVRITAATDTGWAAIATHPQTSKICSISYSEPRGASPSEVGAARVAAMKGYACR